MWTLMTAMWICACDILEQKFFYRFLEGQAKYLQVQPVGFLISEHKMNLLND